MPLTQQEVLAKLAKGHSLKDQEIGDVDFSGYCFKNPVNFSGAIFTGKTVFNQTRFLQGANFCDTKFSGKDTTDFSRAEFRGIAHFAGAEFSSKGGTLFSGAKFAGNAWANFISAEFSGGTYLADTEFFGGFDATRAKFSGKGGANFTHAKFKKSVFFSHVKFLNEENIYFNVIEFLNDKDSLVYFDRIEAKNPESIKFIDINLQNTSFYRTDIEKFSFKSVTFRSLGDREGLIDEDWKKIEEKWNGKIHQDYRRNINGNDYKDVETLYRQLKRNFEEKRDYARAGDFHYGEMEMRRKQERLPYFSLTFLYKWISGYGERWLRALSSLAVACLIFSSLNLLWIEPKTDGLDIRGKDLLVSKWYKQPVCVQMGNSLLFTAGVMTLQKDLNFQVSGQPFGGIVGRSFLILEYLTGPTLIALMLLAIRRRFRR
ncbi:MAG: pentapeptide repeat-containing protein [Nitrospinae bacterium]|nr:pentapeptide repeat-containing protein [Nitrospinota bacterium]